MFDSSSRDAAAVDAAVASQAAVGARIHRASPADVPFIVEAIAAESRHGHFSCDCDRPDVLRGLWHQVQSVVAEGITPMPGERDGACGRAFVIQVDQGNAGFAMMVEHAPGSWRERVELFAMATQAAFRGRGLGRHLVRSLTQETPSAVVYSRCAPASSAMVKLLGSCGYAQVGTLPDGSLALEFRRPVVRGD